MKPHCDRCDKEISEIRIKPWIEANGNKTTNHIFRAKIFLSDGEKEAELCNECRAFIFGQFEHEERQLFYRSLGIGSNAAEPAESTPEPEGEPKKLDHTDIPF